MKDNRHTPSNQTASVALLDSDGCIIKELLASCKQVAGSSVHAIYHDPTVEPDNCEVCLAISSGSFPQTFQISTAHANAEIHIDKADPSLAESGIIHSCHEICSERNLTKSLDLISRLYNMLRLTNQAIFKHKDERRLLNEICEIATTTGKFELAWFGTMDNSNVTPLAYSEKNAQYVLNIHIDIDNPALREGPVARAVLGNSICYVHNTETDPGFKPWREKSREIGAKSVIAMPLRKNSKVIGVFMLYATEVDAFDSTTIDLIENLGNDIGHIFNYIDLDKKRRIAEEQLIRLSIAIEQSRSAILITNTDMRIEYVNPFFCHISEQEEHDLLGNLTSEVFTFVAETEVKIQAAIDLVSAGATWEGEVYFEHDNGNGYWAYLNASPVVNEKNEIYQYIWTFRENGELHNAQETITKLAYYDTLTNLPNRRLFQDRLGKAVELGKRHNQNFALLFIDLDDFKTVNDTLGHDYGDLLLQHMADVLRTQVRESDTVARLGGDEFTIILHDVHTCDQVEKAARKIIKKLNEPAQVGEKIMTISTSIGISMFPRNGQDSDTLMKTADIAMYDAKQSGKNICQVYSDSIAEEQNKLAQLQANLRSALVHDEFSLQFQPLFNIKSGELVGVEALIRWYHPELGWIQPEEFIYAAEKSDLITAIDRWVVTAGCTEMQKLTENGFPPVKLSINVSAASFKKPDEYISHVSETLSKSGFAANLLQIEMTESSLIDDSASATNTINVMKRLGISFAVDDFGTGYSSLSYLQNFPLDVIKIDRSFIRDLGKADGESVIVNAIIDMAHALQLKVLAEGIEHQTQLDYLRAKGCDYFQGFLYAEPMNAVQLLEFTQHRRVI